MKKVFFIFGFSLLLAGCSLQNTPTNPCDVIMGATGYTYYSSQTLGAHFCYSPYPEIKLTITESGDKLLFVYQSIHAGNEDNIDSGSITFLQKDPGISLKAFLSKKFVGGTCTISCTMNQSGNNSCSLLGATQNFIDNSGLIPYNGTCPKEYIANNIYRFFQEDSKHKDTVLFFDDVGGDTGPAGLIESFQLD